MIEIAFDSIQRETGACSGHIEYGKMLSSSSRDFYVYMQSSRQQNAHQCDNGRDTRLLYFSVALQSDHRQNDGKMKMCDF